MIPYNVVLVDDHTLFAKALKTLISSFEDVYVNYIASHGEELIAYLKDAPQQPDVILLDVHMPKMDGVATMQWLTEYHPQIHVLAITMEEDDDIITKMIHRGCKGYLLKDVEPQILYNSIRKAATGAYVYTNLVDEETFRAARTGKDQTFQVFLNNKEQEFLNYVCGTDLSYKEIGEALHLSRGAIDNRRDNLFSKLGVKSRISAVLCAVEYKLVTIPYQTKN